MAGNSKKKSPLVAPKRNFSAARAASKKKSLPRKSGTSSKSWFSRRRKPKAKPRRKANSQGGFITRSIRALMRAIFGLFWWVTVRFSLLMLLIIGAGTTYYYAQLPENAVELMDARQRGSVTLKDRNGEVFAWRGDQFGGLITPETVSPYLQNAVVATEDKRFFWHIGISPRGIASAIRINLRENRGPLEGHGGSTIDQQVAKMVFFSDVSGLERKVKEAFMSFAMELKYTKREILSIYLNRAYLGAGTHGFEAASQRYFGKSASEVNPAEAAMLAGLLKAPSKFAPTRNLAVSQGRAGVIIDLMQDQGYLTKAQADDARNKPARLSKAARDKAGGYFADWIMESGPEFLIKDSKEDILIKTTFDPRLQKQAEAALKYIFDAKLKEGSNAQAAIVVMSADGAVRAMVGGRETGNAGDFNRATQALRQPGSSFKPFVYAAALESGLSPNSICVDEPYTTYVPGSGPYTPKNYTRKFLGPITLTKALAKSVNVCAVKVAEETGLERVRALAADFGITNKVAAGPALALGASEATLIEMTGAYAGILNSGRTATPYGLLELKLQGDDTVLMDKTGGTGQRVINDRAAQELIYMMFQVVEGGTGGRAKLGDRQVAGKTGTTQGARDAWFIGFTADYVAGVWMGYDDNSKLSGVTGGGLPAEIWHEVMARVHEGVPVTPLPMLIPEPLEIVPDPNLEQGDFGQVNTPLNRKTKRQMRREARRKKRQKRKKDAENIVNQVLKDLFNLN